MLKPELLERRCRKDIAFAMERLRKSSSLRKDFKLAPLHQQKLEAMEAFLAGRQAHPERNTPAALPELPQADSRFDRTWTRRSLAKLLGLCRRELRIVPAVTITLPTLDTPAWHACSLCGRWDGRGNIEPAHPPGRLDLGTGRIRPAASSSRMKPKAAVVLGR